MTPKVLSLNLFNVVYIQQNIKKNYLYCVMSVDPVLINFVVVCNMQQYAVFEHRLSALLQITYYACAKKLEPLYPTHGGSRFL
jgi:hypothetical protein